MSPDPNSQLARRAFSGSMFSVAASVVTIGLGFLRATLMTRMLLESDFGVAALALFYMNLAAQIRSIGIDQALIHRKQTDDHVLATYFTLRMALVLGSLVILAGATPLLARFYPDMPLLSAVLFVYIAIDLVKGFNKIQVTILSKEMAFKHLAVADIVSAVAMTIVGPVMAFQGWGVWSIVAENASGILARALLVWLLYRPWRPRLGWDKEIVRWFWGYGRNIWVSTNFDVLLDRFDDFWVGTAMGSESLGIYSRAYEFAGYPRRVIAVPILSVFFPTFARLQDDRTRLSRAFFRAMSLMVRAGCWFTLVFVLTAPEFIRIFLGERWLVMQVTFQLMVVYTLFDPLLVGVENLLMATGHPRIIARTRWLQALVFIPAVIGLGAVASIEGVALAADLMVLLGVVPLFLYSRRVVDYSARRLWLWPLVGMAVTGGATLALGAVWAAWPVWLAFAGKGLFVTLLFGGILWLMEREQLRTGRDMILGMVRGRRGG